MRVAHLLRKYNPIEWGGTESALFQLCRGLRQHEVSSIVFCPEVQDGKGADPLTQAGCSVKRFKARLPIWGISDARKRQLIAVGGNLISFDLIRKLRREPDLSVIHTHALGRLGGTALAVARRRKIHLVVTIHGGYLDIPENVRQSFAEHAQGGWDWGRIIGAAFKARRVVELADAVLTCNAKEAELLRNKYPRQRVLVHPHAVSTERFRKDHREAAWDAFPLLRDRLVLLTVGRIDPPKNQTWLIEQAPEIFRRHPKAVVVLAGACTHQAYGEQVARRIEELGLRDRILLTGGLPPADPRLIGLYQMASAVVLPSETETFGLVILEAWAAGTVVVSSRTSGACSLITPENNGWLFGLNEPLSFHAAVDEALQNPKLAMEFAAAGRQRVSAEFDVSVLAARMKRLYEELCATS